MPVRYATAADIPIMAKVLAASSGPDPLFQAMFPFQQHHPSHFERAIREDLWLSSYDPSKVFMISYEVGSDAETLPGGQVDERGAVEKRLTVKSSVNSETQIITGVAKWVRYGHGLSHVKGLWGWLNPRRLLKPILSTWYRVRRLVFPNRAAVTPTAQNPLPLTYWTLGSSLSRFSRQFLDAPHRKTHWELEVLGVHPRFQGQGYGRKLVEQGLQMVGSDPTGDWPACVMSADGKEGFYLKCGFKELLGFVSKVGDLEGFENPLRKNGVGGGAVIWTR